MLNTLSTEFFSVTLKKNSVYFHLGDRNPPKLTFNQNDEKLVAGAEYALEDVLKAILVVLQVVDLAEYIHINLQQRISHTGALIHFMNPISKKLYGCAVSKLKNMNA